MKTPWMIPAILLLSVTTWTGQTKPKPYDIILRDDKEPFIASFQSKTRDYAVMSCGEYGFGAAAGAKIETVGCNTQVTFDYIWQGNKDFSYHPRRRPGVTVTIKAGDKLHGEFTIDTCAKSATGLIRDEDQNLVLMNLSDSDITDSEGYCGGPPDYH